MRAIDLDQVRGACREAVDQIKATAIDPDADLSPAERRHLRAIAQAILILISEPMPQDGDAVPTSPTLETAR